MPRSSKQIGANAEILYCKKLASEGWIVQRWPSARFTSRHLAYTSQDLWGTDIIAKKKGETRYIQVKSTSQGFPPLRTDTLTALIELAEHINYSAESIRWAGLNRATMEWREIELDVINLLNERQEVK